MAKHNFRVGDEFEGSPIELNHWVTPVWAAGGRVEFDGETATIVYLPEQEEEVVVETPAPVEEAPATLPIEEPVAVEPEVVEEAQAEVAEEPAPVVEEEPEVAIAPAPKYRGRPKKVDEVN